MVRANCELSIYAFPSGFRAMLRYSPSHTAEWRGPFEMFATVWPRKAATMKTIHHDVDDRPHHHLNIRFDTCNCEVSARHFTTRSSPPTACTNR